MSKSKKTPVPSQSVIGEIKFGDEAANGAIAQRLAHRFAESQPNETPVPSQSAIGEIKMARTVRTKALLTERPADRLAASDFQQRNSPPVSQSKCDW